MSKARAMTVELAACYNSIGTEISTAQRDNYMCELLAYANEAHRASDIRVSIYLTACRINRPKVVINIGRSYGHAANKRAPATGSPVDWMNTINKQQQQQMNHRQ